MARELAAAICDMAAPDFQPVYIKVLTCEFGDFDNNEEPVAALVLHVRPRPGSPCPEVAVFKGEAYGWQQVFLQGPAATYAVPGSSAGLEGFLRDLVYGTALRREQGGILRLSQPEEYRSEEKFWDRLHLSVCSVDDVAVVSMEAGPPGVCLTSPNYTDQHQLLAYKDIYSKAATGVTDGDYGRLRDEDIRRLVEGLALMFRQAFRRRGQLALPAVTINLEA